MSSERPGALSRGVATALAVRRLAVQTNVSFLAAAIAYYAFVSAVPLVVLGVALAATVGGDLLADRLVALAGGVLAPAGEDMLRGLVTGRSGLGGVTLAGLLVLVWGALKTFRALDRAFSLVYRTPTGKPLVASLLDAAVALSAVGVGVLAMLAVGAAVALLPGPLVGLLGSAVLLATLVVAFLPLYYLFPDADLSVAEVVPGAVVAALGWTLLGSLFHVYAAYAGTASVYGLLGGVLLALTWLYVGALLLLLGAVTNAVLSGHAPAVDR